MKFRTFITGALAIALAGAGAVVTTAHAADPVPDADVGGGVAGLQATIHVESHTLLQPVVHEDYAEYTVVQGRAVLGVNGGRREASIVNKTVGPVKVKALSGIISGNRRGTPYATAQTVLTGIDISGTKIGVLDTTCIWDEAGGPRGAVTVTDANGNANKPAPNSETVIPGLGTLVLNEQHIESHYIRDNHAPDPLFPYRFMQVIYVYGAHLYLEADAEEIWGTTDVILGFTSCDPVKLPSLSGLKLGTTST